MNHTPTNNVEVGSKDPFGDFLKSQGIKVVDVTPNTSEKDCCEACTMLDNGKFLICDQLCKCHSTFEHGLRRQSSTQTNEIVKRICSIRNGSMDDKQFRATIEHNLTLLHSQAIEEERERIIKMLPVIEVVRDLEEPFWSMKYKVGEDYVQTMKISDDVSEVEKLNIVLSVVRAANDSYKILSEIIH